MFAKVLSVLAIGGLLFSAARVAAGSPAKAKPRETLAVFQGAGTAIRADISPPLRDIPPKLNPFPSKTDNDEKDYPWAGKHGPLDLIDPVAQTWLTRGDAVTAMPAPNVSFDGFANLCAGCAPPDPVGDIGPNHYVAMANSTIAVYSRTGTVLLSPRNINTLWVGFGGNCETENAGDPVVLYDQFAGRWLISQFTAAGPTYYNCVALSTTGDPTGAWQRYAFSNGTSFPDYPKYGIWRDGYYFSTRNTSGSTGQGAYALNRAQMLAGSLTPQVVNFLFPPGATAYYGGDGLLPVDIDGNTLPPVGAPEIYIGSMDNGGPYAAPSDALNIFQFHVDWVTPANSTFTRSATVPVAAFDSTFTPCGGARTCIPQPGTTNKIDILSYRQRVTHRAAYRNFGGYESIVTNQSVSGFNSGTASAIAGVRWYELRDPNGTPTLYQQGTYVPGATDGIHRWMGSAAMDRVGNMALGYSAASGSVFPGIRYTGRLAGDPLGTLPQGEGILVNGVGSQTGGGNRWGDYSSLNVDPVDDCTFWYINEYYTVTSAGTWNLRIGSFTFPSCLCAVIPAAPLATSATASALNRITVAWNDSATAAITRYFVNRATAPAGPYTLIATVTDTSPGVGGGAPYSYNDNTVNGGTTYYYQITADDGVSCTSPVSNTVSATATGSCTLAPAFAGAASASNGGLATCTATVNWTAGTKTCAAASATLTYNVYRSTTSGFTPAAGNRIAVGVAATSFVDNIGISNGVTYYYIVHAVDSLGNEDANAVQVAIAPSGPVTTSTFTETFEGALSGGGFDNAGWTHQFLSGTVDWAWDNSRNQTPTHNWHAADQAATSDSVLTSPSLGAVAGTTLSFWHTFAFESTIYDGGVVEISTDGGTVWNELPGAAWTAGGPTAAISTGFGNPIGGKIGWVAGIVGTLVNVTANLGGYTGQSIKLRWHEGNDSSAAATAPNGWYVDSVTINNAGTAAACAAGSGRPPEVTASGNPGSMTVAKGSTAGTVVLNIADMAGATGYNVYEGVLPMTAGTPYTHGAAGNVCAATTTLATGRRTTAAAGIGTAGSHYYLVTQFTTAEGPSGFDSSAVEIDVAKNTCAP